MPLREKDSTSTMVPSMPGGHFSDASRTSPAFSPKIARSSFSSGVSCVSPLGVTFPTRMGFTEAPMRMMPLSSRSRRALNTLEMSRVISSGPRVARLDVELLDVDRREEVVLDQALGDRHQLRSRTPAPGHERDQHVAPERELALRRAGAVGENLAALDSGPLVHDRLLVDAGVLVGAAEFRQRIDVRAELLAAVAGLARAALDAHDDALGVDLVDDAPRLASTTAPESRLLVASRPVPTGRRLDLEQRHRLALHVGAHQGAVGVVLQERDQRRRHRQASRSWARCPCSPPCRARP